MFESEGNSICGVMAFICQEKSTFYANLAEKLSKMNSGETVQLSSTVGKKTKSKKEKDPLAPKKPLSAYMLFQEEVRQTIKQEFPEMRPTEVMAELGHKWKALPEDEKETYKHKRKQKLEQYLAEVEAYTKQNDHRIPDIKKQKKNLKHMELEEANSAHQAGETDDSETEEADKKIGASRKQNAENDSQPNSDEENVDESHKSQKAKVQASETSPKKKKKKRKKDKSEHHIKKEDTDSSS